MEKWLREAWKIHSNEFNYNGSITYGGKTVQLIRDSSSPWCSEGHGYALLAAALMCDKDAFDGLWFYLNENGYFHKTKIYSTGAVNDAGYVFGSHAPAVYGTGSDTAADGDMDIAMAALIAWKQWGNGSGYYAPGGTGAAGAGGNEIEYRQMALDMMRFMVEKDEGNNLGDNQWTSGDIGFDGYARGGNTGGGFSGETTAWGTTTGLALFGARPQFAGPSENYYDYTGSGYLNTFACALQSYGAARDNTPGTGGWSNVNQYLRASAADAWLQNQLSLSHVFPVVGIYSVNEATQTASFRRFNEGEDFRGMWRKGIDNLWFGDPATTWNPTTHQPTAIGNSYQYSTALKVYNFFKNDIPCIKWANAGPISYQGAAGVAHDYDMDGNPVSFQFHLNWYFGTGAPSILVGSKQNNDYTLAGDFFREAMILWDATTPGDGYITSVPHYYHGWFRQLGLMILTGNHTNPCNIAPTANMKVYKAVNKTYSFAGDLITYRMNYRNYGTLTANNVVVRDTLAAEYDFVSSVPAATPLGGNVYEWGPFTVTGVQNQNIVPTQGGITLVVRIKDTAGLTKICNTTDIRCTNGSGWRSNDIPNEVTDTCQTNCVDIVPAALTITKTASSYLANGGDTITYTLQYCDSSKAGWINGGRSGVNFSFAVDSVPGTATDALTFYLRANHAATEPVINWQNYRISYFLNSSYHGAAWTIALDYVAGFPNGSQQVVTEDLVPGTDARGSWNQRIMLQFGNAGTIPTHQLFNVAGVPSLIHMGNTLAPFIIKGRITAGYNPQDWTDDWSQAAAWETATQNDPFWPITPDWTKGDGTSVPVTKINKEACDATNTSLHSVDNILIEEFDGYTWRRVFGNGPQPGRQLDNIVVTDSLPTQVTFGGWLGTAGTQPGGRTLQWTTASMLVNECQTRKYWTTVNPIGCPGLDQYADNIAFAIADNESYVFDAKRVTITCAAVPTSTPAPASLTKTASQATYNTGDTVTYTINYSNTYGSIIDDPLTSAASWTNRNTPATNMTVTGGKISNISNQSTIMTNNSSNGTNGVIIARVHMQNFAVFGITVRHTGVNGPANGVHITFKPNPPVNGEVRFWNGTTQVGTTQSILINADFDLKVVLNGPTIVCYIDNTLTQSFEGFSTPVSMTGMTVQPGYAGVINGIPGTVTDNYGTHWLTSWHSELDTSYNTAVLDTLPAGVSFIGGSGGAALNTGVVSWPTIAVLNLNQAAAFTWWGQVTGSCQNITNTVRVYPQGIITPIIAATIVRVNCGATTPTFTPTKTPTSSSTVTSTSTFTRTATQSATPTSTYSYTATSSSTPTNTSTRTSTPTVTDTWTVTIFSPTFTPSWTSTATFTATPTFTSSSSPTSTNTPTGTYTFTLTPTMSSSATPTLTSTLTATFTMTHTPSSTPEDTPSSNTPTATRTWTNTFTATQTFTPSPTSSDTATPSSTSTMTPTFTGTRTLTDTQTATPTSSDTPTATGTKTLTNTQTATPTSSDTPTATGTKTLTNTPTASPTSTNTRTLTSTPTSSDTRTYTPTYTASSTPTASLTVTLTPLPSPVNIKIELLSAGEDPKLGSVINYTILITNNTDSPVTNISVWDSVPTYVTLTNIGFAMPLAADSSSTYLHWDLSLDQYGDPFTLPPGEEIRIEYSVRVTSTPPGQDMIINRAGTDYNDLVYTPSFQKHPPQFSDLSLFPRSRPVVFPNPYNLNKDTTVKFDNIVPGSMIRIFTLSGESVKDIMCTTVRTTWDMKNKLGRTISQGIYYFVIVNPGSNTAKKGKLFVIKD